MSTVIKEEAFVDTCAWLELFVPVLPQSVPIRKLIMSRTYRLVTSDYIVDELFSVLKSRNKYQARHAVWTFLNDPDLVDIIFTTRSDLDGAYAIYSKFSDKDWSFTDCLSYYYIRKRKIRTALSIDHHFHEFGIATVLP